MINKKEKKKIAYFSMEFAVDDQLSVFTGGLGVLAADMMMSAADLGREMIGVSLLYKSPQLNKRLLKKCSEVVEVEIEKRKIKIEIWRFDMVGKAGIVPIYFLSTDCSGNNLKDREITRDIYPDDPFFRLAQLAVLGIGGVRALKSLNHKIDRYHMNEGHAALCAMELFRESSSLLKIRKQCTFTTHTPVSAGHDYFSWSLVFQVLGDQYFKGLTKITKQENLGTTELALYLSQRKNSVSLVHNQVCRGMFSDYKFLNVTNGIYHPRWTGKYIAKFFDKYIQDWREHPEKIVISKSLKQEILEVRKQEKKELVEWINSQEKFFSFDNVKKRDLLKEDVLTIGWARRVVPYKRVDLILNNIEKLHEIAGRKLQIIFAGSVRNNDLGYSRMMIMRIKKSARTLRGKVKIVYIPEYNLDIAKRLVAGCDAWLNTPVRGYEASGTSGMKAALNGGINVSVLDGWWPEALAIDARAGFHFGKTAKYQVQQSMVDARDLYRVLPQVIKSYENKEKWVEMVCASLGLIKKFNTHCVVQEYFKKMWRD